METKDAFEKSIELFDFVARNVRRLDNEPYVVLFTMEPLSRIQDLIEMFYAGEDKIVFGGEEFVIDLMQCEDRQAYWVMYRPNCPLEHLPRILPYQNTQRLPVDKARTNGKTLEEWKAWWLDGVSAMATTGGGGE
jgi:hypothetical protein